MGQARVGVGEVHPSPLPARCTIPCPPPPHPSPSHPIPTPIEPPTHPPTHLFAHPTTRPPLALVPARHPQGRRVAVKIVGGTSAGHHGAAEQALKGLQREVQVLSRCRHPNVVALLGASLQPKPQRHM